MSTRDSLALVSWNTPHEIHIYLEMLDGKYYIQTEDGRISVPKKYAKAFAEILNKEDLK